MDTGLGQYRAHKMVVNWRNLWLLLLTLTLAQGNVPTFDEDTSGKQILFLPRDTPVGTHIYRLRASDSDRDYPLTFEVGPRSPKDIIRLEQIGPQEADVVLLKQAIKVGDMYVTNINVKDSSGQETEIAFRINVTESRCTPDTVFVQYNKTYVVPESWEVGRVIGHVLARSSDYINRDVDLQLLVGTDHFAISPIWEKPKIIRGSITLTAALDYEKQSFYSVTVAAYNGYVDRSVDTRNIVYLSIFIVVEDEQDTPPIFTQIPTYIQMPAQLETGGLVMEVNAEDGDTANKRAIRYSIIPGPDSHYFHIDPSNGQVVSSVSANELSKQNGGVPIVLTIQAEEIVEGGGGEAASTQRQVIIMPAEKQRVAPTFSQSSYQAEIEEHSAQSTPVNMNGPTTVTDEDQGLAGAFTLHLENDDGQQVDHILEITPSVIVGQGTFQIIVKNPQLLDYENFHQLKFKIVAKELGDNPLTTTADVVLNLKDVNDKAPQFSKNVYEAQLSEDAKAGTVVAQISAVDPDQGPNGQFTYVNISGAGASKLHLDRETGRVTLATSDHGFDRETQDEYWFTITATDNGSPPRTNTTQLHLRLLDTNDNAPRFRHEIYERALVPDLPLTGPVLEVEAVDADEAGTNNSMVRYELISGNWGDAFELNRTSGALTLKKPISEASKEAGDDMSLMEREEGVYTLTIRAYDLGVPHQSSTATAYIYYKKPSASMNVTIRYIYPSSVEDINQDLDKMERLLARLNGAPTSITGVQAYEEQNIQKRSTSNSDKSVITATVRYHKTSLVDLSAVARELNATSNTVIIDKPTTSSTGGTTGGQLQDPTLATAGSSEYGWKVALITLLVMLAICLLILLCFCLYRQCGKLDDRKVHPTDKQVDGNRSQVIEVATLERPLPANGLNGKKEVPVRIVEEEVDQIVDDTRPRVNPPHDYHQQQQRPSAAQHLHHHQPPAQQQQQLGPDPKVSYSRHFHRPDATGNSVRVLHHHHHHNPQQHHTMAEIEEEASEEFTRPYYPVGDHEVLMAVEPEWINPNVDYVQAEYMEPPYRRVWVKKYRGGGSLPDRFAQSYNEDDERNYVERPRHRPRERGRAVTRASFRDPTEYTRPTERFIKLDSGEILQLDDENDPTNNYMDTNPTSDVIPDDPNAADSSDVSPQSFPSTAKDTLINNNLNNNDNNAPQPPPVIKSKNARTKNKSKGESRYMDWYNAKSKDKHKPASDKAEDNSKQTVPDTIADDGVRGKPAAATTEAATNAARANNAAALDVIEGEMRLGGNPFVEDEEDSGISGHTDSFKSSRKQFLEKKSLFTIAYNGMQNRQDALKEREMSANGERLAS